ncbi:MAG TPA: hypothetical protein EYP88_02480 [Anaerolineales bacterium]|nr:hypothetical protein [Anaerolineales bacterium]
MLSEESKAQYMKRYKQAKQKGIKFWPDIIYKDLIVSFALFLILVGLATFIGVASEARADPSDSSYIPRPEWYFLFLFKFLAIYGQVPVLGKIEWIATALIPGIAVGALFLLPFIDRNPFRHFSKRRFGIAIMSLIVVWMILLTFMATLPLPPNDAELAFSNMLQAVVGLWIPFAAILLLFFLAFINNTNDKNAASQKKLMLGVSGVAMVAMVAVFAFTVAATTFALKMVLTRRCQ